MLFGKNEEEWITKGGKHTANEILQEPETWNKTMNQVKGMKDEIQKFVENVTRHDNYEIILTGAGTSEFVGNALMPYLVNLYDGHVKSYATTDLVSCPSLYLSDNRPTLLVSFARSGNSPESVATVELADQICGDNVYHLMITCNVEGALSKIGREHKHALVIDLTPETNDLGFAMTSSYTNMMLACMLSLNSENMDALCEDMKGISEGVGDFYELAGDYLGNIVDNFDFKRIVYLGSGPLKGIAQESQLKMLELTGGKVTTMYDSSMGFRHGPKSVVNDDTLTICYVSDDPYTRQYDLDIVKEMCAGRNNNKVYVVMNKMDDEIKELADGVYSFNLMKEYNAMLLSFAYITFAQILSLLKSASLGIDPDNPNPSGLVNRVVKGVIIHEYTK